MGERSFRKRAPARPYASDLTASASDQFGNHPSSVPGWKFVPIEAYLGTVDGHVSVTVE